MTGILTFVLAEVCLYVQSQNVVSLHREMHVFVWDQQWGSNPLQTKLVLVLQYMLRSHIHV